MSVTGAVLLRDGHWLCVESGEMKIDSAHSAMRFQDVSVKYSLKSTIILRDGKVVFFSFSHFSGFVLAGKAELYWVMYCVSKGNGIVEESSCNSNILSKLNLEFNQSH